MNIITDNNGLRINGIILNEKIFQEELVNYQIRDRKDFINDLIDWISEATKDKELMKEDLKYLINLDDTFMFSNISTNEYICFSDNPDRFNEIAAEILKINKDLN